MEIGTRLIGVILRLLNVLLWPLFWLKTRTAKPLPPPLASPYLTKSAKELAEAVKNGEITSEKLVLVHIQRVKEVNPYLNAVVEERYRAALDEAKAIDRQLDEARKNQKVEDLVREKPLLGVPCSVKESCSLAGLSNSVGCLENAGSRATSDGDAVNLVRKAGAIPLLVSNTPELCLGWESTNLLHGATNNPYCVYRTPGGSSGGEAALIACGAVPFGVASDVAGSIRLPAAFCGVFGHKPTPGVVSLGGHVPTLGDALFPRLLAVGPLSRRAADLPLLLQVMAADRAHALRLHKPVQLDTLNVYFMTEATISPALIPVESCIKDMIINAVNYLQKECGSTVRQEKFPDLEDSVETSVSVFFSMSDIPNMLRDPANPKRQRSLIMELLKTLFGGGTRSLQALGFTLISKTQLLIPKSRSSYYKAKADRLREEMTKTLGDNGVFIYPVFNGRAYYHNQVFLKTSGVMYTMIFNILGMPATSVPMGTYKGLPVSIQVVAAPNQDRLCLAVARQLEIGFGGWRPPQ